MKLQKPNSQLKNYCWNDNNSLNVPTKVVNSKSNCEKQRYTVWPKKNCNALI